MLMLHMKQRFRVTHDDSGYRSIKPNAINNHGGIMRGTTSTHKGRRGNIRRTLNANANVRVFPVNHLNGPIFATWKFYTPILTTSLFLTVKQPRFSYNRPAITSPLTVLRWIGMKKIGEHFTPAADTWVEPWGLKYRLHGCDRSRGYRRLSF